MNEQPRHPLRIPPHHRVAATPYREYAQSELSRLLGLKGEPPQLLRAADYFKAYRAYRVWNCEELAGYLGCSVKHVHDVESGNILPNKEILSVLQEKRSPIAAPLEALVVQQRLQAIAEAGGGRAGRHMNALPPRFWHGVLDEDRMAAFTIESKGDYLRAFRNRHGLSAKEVAGALGLSVQTVNGTEQGHPLHAAYETLADYYSHQPLQPAFDRARFNGLERTPSCWVEQLNRRTAADPARGR